MGLFLAWKFRKQSKMDFIHSGRTQTGACAVMKLFEKLLFCNFLLLFSTVSERERLADYQKICSNSRRTQLCRLW